jgi:hypothetical protein
MKPLHAHHVVTVRKIAFALGSIAMLAAPAIARAQASANTPDFTGVWGIYRGGKGADPKFAPPAPSPLVLKPE